MADNRIESANNPANVKEKKTLPKGFVPLSGKVQQLTVPEREGYYRRWFRGDPSRIARAKQAGFEHVMKREVNLANSDLGGNPEAFVGTDLGDLVSVISGDEKGADGQPGRMYLMECPIEFYEASRAFIEEQNDGIVEALTQGTVGGGDERNHRYSSISEAQRRGQNAVPELFQKNKSKRRL